MDLVAGLTDYVGIAADVASTIALIIAIVEIVRLLRAGQRERLRARADEIRTSVRNVLRSNERAARLLEYSSDHPILAESFPREEGGDLAYAWAAFSQAVTDRWLPQRSEESIESAISRLGDGKERVALTAVALASNSGLQQAIEAYDELVWRTKALPGWLSILNVNTEQGRRVFDRSMHPGHLFGSLENMANSLATRDHASILALRKDFRDDLMGVASSTHAAFSPLLHAHLSFNRSVGRAFLKMPDQMLVCAAQRPLIDVQVESEPGALSEPETLRDAAQPVLELDSEVHGALDESLGLIELRHRTRMRHARSVFGVPDTDSG